MGSVPLIVEPLLIEGVKNPCRRVNEAIFAVLSPQVGRLFHVHDYLTNARHLEGKGAQVSVVPIGNSKSQSSMFRLRAANGTAIPTYSTRKLTVNLRNRRQYLKKYIISDVRIAIFGIDFVQHYELMVDSCGLRLINVLSNSELMGFLLRTLDPRNSLRKSSNFVVLF